MKHRRLLRKIDVINTVPGIHVCLHLCKILIEHDISRVAVSRSQHVVCLSLSLCHSLPLKSRNISRRDVDIDSKNYYNSKDEAQIYHYSYQSLLVTLPIKLQCMFMNCSKSYIRAMKRFDLFAKKT